MIYLLLTLRRCALPLLLTATSLASSAQAPFTDDHALTVCEYAALFEDPSILAESSLRVEEWRQWQTVQNYTFGKDRGSMLMITDLRSLHPVFREKVFKLIDICKRKGINLAIVEAFRTRSKQNEYKAMGTKFTRSAGGASKHQYGLAVDVVPIIDSVAVWNNKTLWKKIGVVGESLGLRWGGRWRSIYDPGHFEWTGGMSTSDLAKGHLPLNGVDACNEEDINRVAEGWKAWETEQAVVSRAPSTGNASR